MSSVAKDANAQNPTMNPAPIESTRAAIVFRVSPSTQLFYLLRNKKAAHFCAALSPAGSLCNGVVEVRYGKFQIKTLPEFGFSKAFLRAARIGRAPQAGSTSSLWTVAANRHQTRLRRGGLDHVKRFLVFLRDPLRSSAVKLSLRLISPQRKRRGAEAGKKSAVNY